MAPPPAPMQPALVQPGQQMDLQMIDSLVEELCKVQANNRLEMDKLLKELEEVRDQLLQKSQSPSQEQNSDSSSPSTRLEMERLRIQAAKLSQKVECSQSAYNDLMTIVDSQEELVHKAMNMARHQANEVHTRTINWHKYYNGKMQELRDQNLQLRLEHQDWQESLGRMMAYLRDAWNVASDLERPLLEKIAGQRRQIIVMRRLLGWENDRDLDSDDEEENREEEAEQARRDIERLQLEQEEHIVVRGRGTDPSRREAT